MPSGQEGTMSGLTVPGSARIGAMVRQSFTAMTPAERTRVTAMYGAIAGLHLLGFFILFAFVVPSHYKGLGTGVANPGLGHPGPLPPQPARRNSARGGDTHRHYRLKSQPRITR
jgi:hypothetical protein